MNVQRDGKWILDHLRWRASRMTARQRIVTVPRNDAKTVIARSP
jgi:hypothetical protein